MTLLKAPVLDIADFAAALCRRRATA